jgi:hypothetical protein
MKSGLGCMLIVLALIMSGCQKCDDVVDTTHYVRVRIDPNSADIFVTATTPAINRMAECQNRLMTRMVWINNNLEKCLEKLESERGLEPIPRKGRFIPKSDPNFVPPPEQWYESYEPEKWHPAMTFSNVNGIVLYMNLYSLNMCNQAQGMDDYIENLDQRMKRLEKYINESKDANTPAVNK